MNYVQATVKSLGLVSALVLTVGALTLTGTVVPAQAQNFTVLHTFAGGASEPSGVSGDLAQGRDGNLYGASYSGGEYNNGTIYKISPSSGTPVVLYSFPTSDRCGSGLTLGTDGNLYGACE